MLKDRYKFNLLLPEAFVLKDTITHTFQKYGNTKEIHLMLALSVLQDAQKRLTGSLAFPESKIKFFLKRNEALAFHTLYMSHIIQNNFTTVDINTQIHKTL